MNQAPAKKGLSTTAIVLIVVAIVSVLLVGTCVGAGLWVGGKVKEVEQNIADGGLVRVSPPEVLTELAGPKKDYVGFWSSGDDTLEIGADGQLALKQEEANTKQSIKAPIAAFRGDDIVLRVGIDITIRVTQPPKRSGSEWTMVARGVTWKRVATD